MRSNQLLPKGSEYVHVWSNAGGCSMFIQTSQRRTRTADANVSCVPRQYLLSPNLLDGAVAHIAHQRSRALKPEEKSVLHSLLPKTRRSGRGAGGTAAGT